MAERRIDRIATILEERGGKAPLADVLVELKRIEENDGIAYGALHVAIQQENQRLEQGGERRKFRTVGHGEQRGWVSLESKSEFIPGSAAQKIEAMIREANRRVDDEIRARLQAMAWRTFEDTFLTQVLDKLGFQAVEITQPTRDGGVDARVSYKRGLVEAKAIVSAKRWTSRSVSVEEVRNLRGIRGDEDTAIVITTGQFSADAKNEAKPSQNQRAVYLIDGDQLVEICKQHDIGISKKVLPPLLVIDEEELDTESAPSPAPVPESSAGTAVSFPNAVLRFRDEMLGDRERGITANEISSLLGLKESTVRVYLGDADRRAQIGERIREDPDLRVKAIRIVGERRSRL